MLFMGDIRGAYRGLARRLGDHRRDLIERVGSESQGFGRAVSKSFPELFSEFFSEFFLESFSGSFSGLGSRTHLHAFSLSERASASGDLPRALRESFRSG